MMRAFRRAAAALLALGASLACAQEWPSRPIRWIVPYLPATAPDTTVRVVAEAMSEILRQPVIVDNKAGAAGNIGAQAAARSAADGYTWVYSAAPMATNMRMYKSPGFDVMKDFTHVGRIGSSDVVVVVPADAGIKSLAELIERARKNPGRLNYGSGGIGTPSHLGAELLFSSTAVDVVHVPFKGAAESVNALLAKQVDVVLPIFQVALPHVLSGKLTALAVTGPNRNPRLADVPTLGEAGIPGIVLTSFGGLSVPAGTPAPIVKRLSDVLQQALARPGVRARLEALGSRVETNSPDQYAADFRAEIVMAEKMMRAANLVAQ